MTDGAQWLRLAATFSEGFEKALLPTWASTFSVSTYENALSSNVLTLKAVKITRSVCLERQINHLCRSNLYQVAVDGFTDFAFRIGMTATRLVAAAIIDQRNAQHENRIIVV
jgi:hypothetical protein